MAFCSAKGRILLAFGVPFNQQAARNAVADGRVERFFRFFPAALQDEYFNFREAWLKLPNRNDVVGEAGLKGRIIYRIKK